MTKKSELLTVQTQIITIETNHFADEKYKMAIECVSPTGTNRMCILWGTGKVPEVYVGDTVNLTGRIKNNVFLIYTMKIIKSRENNSERIDSG